MRCQHPSLILGTCEALELWITFLESLLHLHVFEYKNSNQFTALTTSKNRVDIIFKYPKIRSNSQTDN